MKIKKIGHCCLVIQTKGLTILTDPGTYSTEQDTLTGIDLVVISHEHADHFHIESVKAILKNNPNVKIITNAAVGKKLDEAGIAYEVVDGTNATDFKGVAIEAADHRHGEIFEEMGQVQNTAYYIDGALYYPGDSFGIPTKPVDILALPIAGPWVRIGDAIRYALEIKPRVAFPVHEAMYKDPKGVHGMLQEIFSKLGVNFVPMAAGDEHEF